MQSGKWRNSYAGAPLGLCRLERAVGGGRLHHPGGMLITTRPVGPHRIAASAASTIRIKLAYATANHASLNSRKHLLCTLGL